MSDNHRRYRSIRSALCQLFPQGIDRNTKDLLILAALISGIVGSQRTNYPKIASKVPDPPAYELRAQENFQMDEPGISFRIDLVIYEKVSQQAICVLDTKYKSTVTPSADDISQIVFYALAKNSQEAILIYPDTHCQPISQTVNGIHIRTVAFNLHDDLEKAGDEFLKALRLEKLLAV